MKAEDASFAAGREVGGYRIEHLLGEGGMGAVYAAVEPTIGRRVAIKVLRRELAGDKNHTARFEREARSVSSLRHPTIIDIFSFGTLEDGRPFFVMPLLSGHNLREHLAKHGALAPKAAWQIAREVAAGLAAAHASGVLHRDLKPDNVFLAEYAGRPPQPMLLDFGLAKRIDAGAEEIDPKDEMKITATGVPIGTPIYMAPEQWWSAPSSPATDQYAFGVLLFEMLAGRPPFTSQQFAQLLQQHIHEKPPALRDVGCDVTDAAEALVARLLEKEAANRYADFDEVITAGDEAFAVVAEAAQEPAPLTTSVAERAVITASKTALVEVHAVTEPNAMSAVISRSGANRGAKRAYVVTLVAGFLVLWGVGYAGQIRWNLVDWFKSMGWGGPVVAFVTIVAAIALPRIAIAARTRPGFGPLALAVALAPAVLSLPSALTGWQVVTTTAEKLEPGRYFVIMHAGYFEVGLSTFCGQALSSMLCLGLILLLGPPSLGLRSAWTSGAFAVAALALAGLALGMASPTLVLLPGAAAVALLGTWTTTPSSLARERAIAAASAVLCARGAAHSRADAFAARAWFETHTRADRVDAVVNAATDKHYTLIASSFAIIAVIVVAVLVVLRAKRAGLLAGETARNRLWLGGLQLALVAMALLPAATFERDLDARRKLLLSALSEQFVLFARLDPPSFAGDSLAEVVRAPALQITPDTVALNGKPVAMLTALDSPTGRQTIANAIITGLAAPLADVPLERAADPLARRIDLALLVDRRVPWSRVEQVLTLAFEGGARSADLLLTRGQEPSIPSGAPPEASHLLPGDFVALPLTLGHEGVQPKGTTALADVATELLAQPGAGEHAVGIGLPTGGK